LQPDHEDIGELRVQAISNQLTFAASERERATRAAALETLARYGGQDGPPSRRRRYGASTVAFAEVEAGRL
jgi:hypothetical protein